MAEAITAFLQIAALFFSWIFGKAAERKQRAKEIATLFKKVNMQGDKLFDQIWDECNRQSSVRWEDIPVRQPDE